MCFPSTRGCGKSAPLLRPIEQGPAGERRKRATRPAPDSGAKKGRARPSDGVLGSFPSLPGKLARTCVRSHKDKAGWAGGTGRRAAGAAAVPSGPLASTPISQTFADGLRPGRDRSGQVCRGLFYFWRPDPFGSATGCRYLSLVIVSRQS